MIIQMFNFFLMSVGILILFPGVGQREDHRDLCVEYTCADCHSDLTGFPVVHAPVSEACDYCHQSTGIQHPGGGAKGFELTDSLPELCFYCHTEPDGQQVHPFAGLRGNCLECHDAHGSSEPFLFRRPEEDLCLSCHNREYQTDSSVTPDISSLVRGNSIPHSAISMGGCLTCHQMHEAPFGKFLVEACAEDPYLEVTPDRFALCFTCHDPALIEAKEDPRATNFRNGNTNLHRIHMEGERGRNCKLCHNFHGSKIPFLVEEYVAYGSWDMPLKFIRDPDGGSCQPGCHGTLSYKRN